MRARWSPRWPPFYRDREAGGTRYFTFRLARDLKMTVGELNAQMSSAEFTDWMAFYALEAQDRERAEAKAKAKRGR